MQKLSVGLVVLTKLPSATERVAILQIRGEFNHEKMGNESFPGACQVTVHGGAEGPERALDTLFRETREEIGGEALGIILRQNDNGRLLELHQANSPEKSIITFGVIVEPHFLKTLRFGPSSGGIRLLPESHMTSVINLKQFNKIDGVTDRSITAMFADEIESVRLAFEKC